MNDIRRIIGFCWSRYKQDSDYRKKYLGSLMKVTVYLFASWLILWVIGYLINIRLFGILGWIAKTAFFIGLIAMLLGWATQTKLPNNNKNTGWSKTGNNTPNWDNSGWGTNQNSSNNSNSHWDNSGWS